MPRQCTIADNLFFRTRLLRRENAERFASCLQSNSRFANVSIHFSDRSTGGRRYFVTYRPSNNDRLHDMAEREQDKRTQKALAEGAGYQWFLDTDRPGRPFYYCLSTSGEVYEVTACSCTCPDYEFRCSRSNHGLRCKHQIAYEMAVERGELTPISALIARMPVPATESRSYAAEAAAA